MHRIGKGAFLLALGMSVAAAEEDQDEPITPAAAGEEGGGSIPHGVLPPGSKTVESR
jgi:hypothetical protein